jgi:hypothetical protein
VSAKHTPGEWVVGDAPDSRVAVYAGNACIAVVGEQGYPVIDADARLIAAAPELLGAVQSAVSLLTDPDAGEDEANQVLAELEAALAKAKGEL